MPYDVDTLQIEIGASSESAAKQVRELADELKGLKQMLSTGWKNPIREISGSGQGQRSPSQTRKDNEDSGSTKSADLMRQVGENTKIRVDASDVDKAKKKVDLLTKTMNGLKRIAFYRIIRAAVKEIGGALNEGTKNAYWYSRTMGGQIGYVADAFDRLSTKSFTMQNQLGAAWATLKAAVIPILVEIVQWATQAANAITQFFAVLGGKNVYMKAVDTAKKWADSTAKGASAAKAWRNQLMGFDEINRLEEPASGGSGGSGGSTPNYAEMFDVMPVNKKLQDIMGIVRKHLKELKALAIGAELGLGMALLLSGANVPLGLALVAHGAYGAYQYLKENWGYITDNVGNALSTLAMFVAGAEIGLGLVFALSGANVPLGLALIASGILVGVNEMALNWDEIPSRIKKVIATIDLIIGGALVGVGAVLAFSGANIPLGLAAIVAGLSLSAAGAKLNWDNMPSKVESVVKTIVTVVSGALIAIGALLLFATPAFSPLGLGLLAAGAIGLATSAGVDWDWLVSKVKTVFSEILAILSGATLVLGVLLCLSGAGIGLGLAMIAAGLAGSFAAWSIDSNPITNFVRGVANGIIGILNTAVGIIESMINGVIDGINAALSFVNSAADLVGISINWNVGHIALPRVRQFATGGFPEDGLFFANHSELVGKFSNGRTAVANNEQIISGITEGVEEGNEGVIGVLYQILSVAQEISNNRDGGGSDITELTREITRNQARESRAYGM